MQKTGHSKLPKGLTLNVYNCLDLHSHTVHSQLFSTKCLKHVDKAKWIFPNNIWSTRFDPYQIFYNCQHCLVLLLHAYACCLLSSVRISTLRRATTATGWLEKWGHFRFASHFQRSMRSIQTGKKSNMHVLVIVKGRDTITVKNSRMHS